MRKYYRLQWQALLTENVHQPYRENTNLSVIESALSKNNRLIVLVKTKINSSYLRSLDKNCSWLSLIFDAYAESTTKNFCFNDLLNYRITIVITVVQSNKLTKKDLNHSFSTMDFRGSFFPLKSQIIKAPGYLKSNLIKISVIK